MWEKDRLDRKKYAEFLYTLIHNSDNYKRAEGEDAYVIALDSPWGTGKTYFLDLFERWLRQEKGMQVIHYSAWENDFWDNAFLPLLYAIYHQDFCKNDTTNLENRKYVKSILHLAIRLGRNAGLNKLETIVGEEGVKDLKDAFDHIEDKKPVSVGSVFQKYEEFRDAYETIKELLQKNRPKGEKLLIIVDELDRCRPDFAVQTLEVVKHLFNVEGLVFLFSVDMDQLGCVIRGIYGESLDARNYLNRFFQYVTHLPEPNMGKYIELLFNEKRQNFEEIHQFDMHKEMLVRILTGLVNGFQLSLRELDTIWKNYLVLYDYKLKDYECTEAHLGYLMFLILKYRYADMESEMAKAGYRTLSERKELKLCNRLLETESPLKDLLTADISQSLNDLTGTLRNTRNPILDKIEAKILRSENDRLTYSYGSGQIDYTCVQPTTSFAGILYAPDFGLWEKVKGQTIFQYMKDQLELITFEGEKE